VAEGLDRADCEGCGQAAVTDVDPGGNMEKAGGREIEMGNHECLAQVCTDATGR
jgi:hypothetical protein